MQKKVKVKTMGFLKNKLKQMVEETFPALTNLEKTLSDIEYLGDIGKSDDGIDWMVYEHSVSSNHPYQKIDADYEAFIDQNVFSLNDFYKDIGKNKDVEGISSNVEPEEDYIVDGLDIRKPYSDNVFDYHYDEKEQSWIGVPRDEIHEPIEIELEPIQIDETFEFDWDSETVVSETDKWVKRYDFSDIVNKYKESYPSIYSSKDIPDTIKGTIQSEVIDAVQNLKPTVTLISGCIKTEILDAKNEESGDSVNHPSHYTQGKYEVIDYIIQEYGWDFLLANVIKYVSRAGHKADPNLSIDEKAIEDLKKASWYLEKQMQEIAEAGILKEDISMSDYAEDKQFSQNLGNVIQYLHLAKLANDALETDTRDRFLEKAMAYLKIEIEYRQLELETKKSGVDE